MAISYTTKLYVFCLLVALSLPGATGPTFAASEAVSTTQRSVKALFSQTKPQCIGRYLIDVPASFNNQSGMVVFIDDFKIESQLQYRPAFEQKITRREKELNDISNNPENTPDNAPFIKQIIRLPDNNGVIFDRNISGEDDLERMLEAYSYVNGITFTITTKILDLSAEKYASRKKTYLNAGFSEAQTNDKPAKLAALQSLISRLSGRKNDDIPIGSGVCIPNGFVKDDGLQHKERVTSSYVNDDFVFSIKTNNTTPGSNDTLLNRSPEIEDAMKNADYHLIKKGELMHNSIKMQEWLVTGMQELNTVKDKATLFDFILYANEATASPTTPVLSISLQNRGQLTHYNEAKMVSIWDKLVSTLRYRPGAF